jgi:recombination associated protein RdgC
MFGANQKILPGSVISQIVQERAQKQAQKQEHPVGRKQLRDIRERVIEELMPRALSRRTTLRGWIDPANGWLALDTATAKKGDEFIEGLGAADVDLKLKRLDTAQSPALAMTNWLASGKAPAPFSIDQDLELRAPGENRATVRYVNHPLDGREIREHISGGKAATRLALTWKNRVSFVLTDQWQIKRVNFIDVMKEDPDVGADDAEEQFDIEFVLMAGELSALLGDLTKALGGVKD